MGGPVMPGPGSQTPFSAAFAVPSSTRPAPLRGAGGGGPPPRRPCGCSCTSRPPPTIPDPACPPATGEVRTAANTTAPADNSVHFIIDDVLQPPDATADTTSAHEARRRRPSASPGLRQGSAHVFADEFGHLEHVDRRLAAEDRLQRRVGVDHSLVLGVLQLVLLDVGPQPLRHFRARNRLRAHDLGQGGVRRDWRHERGIRLAPSALLLCALGRLFRARRTRALRRLACRLLCRLLRRLLGHLLSFCNTRRYAAPD